MVRLFTVAFAISTIHLKHIHNFNIVRRTPYPLQVKSNSNQDDAAEKVNVDYKLYAARRVLQLKNMYSPKTFMPCAYCDGTGFVDCHKCNQGCWKCSRTTLIKCHYCGGTGESTPGLHFMAINYEDHEPDNKGSCDNEPDCKMSCDSRSDLKKKC